MTQQEFLNRYQIMYRVVPNGSQLIIIDKELGDLVKKYGFSKGQTSNEEFEFFTGKSLDEMETDLYASEIANEFKITE